VAISEIMCHPYDHRDGTNLLDNVEDEYVELHNPTLQPIALFDTNGVWRLDGGIGFLFPTNTTLPPGGYLLVVPFDPTNTAARSLFCQKYGLDRAVPVLGPYSGKLGNTTDRVALEKPLLPDREGELLAWVILDEVIYSRGWPWPQVWPDGVGGSIQRLESSAPGNNPAVWRVGWPTPGFASLQQSASDFDLDGLPDRWEVHAGLDPVDPNAANGPSGDPDADGLTNLAEFRGDTDPRATTLRLLSARAVGRELELEFNQPAGNAVHLEAAHTLDTATWTVVASYPIQASARILRLVETRHGASSQRFYRVALP
jgi:hypothetical protein